MAFAETCSAVWLLLLPPQCHCMAWEITLQHILENISLSKCVALFPFNSFGPSLMKDFTACLRGSWKSAEMLHIYIRNFILLDHNTSWTSGINPHTWVIVAFLLGHSSSCMLSSFESTQAYHLLGIWTLAITGFLSSFEDYCQGNSWFFSVSKLRCVPYIPSSDLYGLVYSLYPSRIWSGSCNSIHLNTQIYQLLEGHEIMLNSALFLDL